MYTGWKGNLISIFNIHHSVSSFPQGVTVYMVLGLRVSVKVTHQFHYSAYLPSFNFVCFKFSLTRGVWAGEQQDFQQKT